MLPSFRIFLPFHAELTVLARPISIRLDLVDVLSGTTRPGFEHDHLSAHSRIHTRTFRVRACAQISARQRMHGTGCNSSWTARVEIIKPARRADNDFDPINSAFRALPPLRCHVNGKRMGPSCERSNIWKEDGTIVQTTSRYFEIILIVIEKWDCLILTFVLFNAFLEFWF